jgi:hypothetical protein
MAMGATDAAHEAVPNDDPCTDWDEINWLAR